MAGVSVGRSKVRTVWVLEVSSSSLSRLLYDVPLARCDSMMLSKWRLKVSSAAQRGPETRMGDFRAGLWLSKKVSVGLDRKEGFSNNVSVSVTKSLNESEPRKRLFSVTVNNIHYQDEIYSPVCCKAVNN